MFSVVSSSAIRLRLGVAIVVACVSLLTAKYVFLNVHVTADENAYIFQSSTFLEGRITRPLPLLPHVFNHQMIIRCEDIGLVSRYAPGHAIWLMPGTFFDNPRIMIAVAAGLSLWFLTGCAVVLGAPWWSAAFFLCVSPYFLFMHGTILSHASGMMSVSLMLWGYFLWAHERKRAGIVIAGLAWAFLFINRTYTAALIAVPIGADALLDAARNFRQPKVWRSVCLFAVIALIGPLLFMLYNWLVTNDPTLTPYVYYHPTQKPGFGSWTSHTPALGIQYLINNVRLLDLWILGFRGGLLLFVVLLISGWNNRWSLFAVTPILLIIFGHISFWYEGVNSCGPFYYFETLPYFAMLWVLACRKLEKTTRSGVRRGIIIICGILIAGNAFAFMIREGRNIASGNAHYARLHAIVNTAPPNSIVAITNVDDDFLDSQLKNYKSINSDVLMIRSMGKYDLISARYFSDRSFFLLDGNAPDRLKPLNFDDSKFNHIVPLDKTARYVGRYELGADQRLMRLCLPEMGEGWMGFGQYPFLPSGHFHAVFQLILNDVDQAKPVRLEIASDEGEKIIAARVISVGGAEKEYILEFQLNDFSHIEPRIWYGGSGEVELRDIHINEL